MRSIARLRVGALAGALSSLLVLLVAAPGGADPSSIGNLKQQNASLAAQSNSAVVELYSLESRLREQQARADSLRAELDAVSAERDSVRNRLAVVRGELRVTQRNLGQRLVRIYEQGRPDALAILLGTQSLGDAITDLEHMNALAGQDKYMYLQARRARRSLVRLTNSLAAREDNLAALEQQAASAAADLEAARAERQSYLADLKNQQQLNEQQISSLEQQAKTAEKRSSTIAAQQAIAPTPAPAAPVAPSPPVRGHGRALTVVATAYALPGTTASGLPVGPGIVAVDPTVIPFGTHMTIPGYGEGVAADTGSAIIGARIDVWVPTEAQANQWGVQTVTIYLH
jgi:peptidoglycan DL-endopeptidase CwlO